MWPSFMYSIITELYHSWQWQAIFIRLLFSHRMVWGLYGDGWIQCPQCSVFTQHNNYNYSQTCVKSLPKGSTISGCLAEVNISKKLKFRNILFGCLRHVGCLIEVATYSGLTVYGQHKGCYICCICTCYFYCSYIMHIHATPTTVLLCL